MISFLLTVAIISVCCLIIGAILETTIFYQPIPVWWIEEKPIVYKLQSIQRRQYRDKFGD